MKTSVRLLTSSLLLLSISAIGTAGETIEKPIGHGRLRGIGAARPIYKSDIAQEDQSTDTRANSATAQSAASLSRDTHSTELPASMIYQREKPIGYGRLLGVGISGPIYRSDLSINDEDQNPISSSFRKK